MGDEEFGGSFSNGFFSCMMKNYNTYSPSLLTLKRSLFLWWLFWDNCFLSTRFHCFY